jgi:hypothetical protein
MIIHSTSEELPRGLDMICVSCVHLALPILNELIFESGNHLIVPV